MSKRSKRKSNVKSSILVLLLMAILLVSSTYAWFTANLEVVISTLEVHVDAQNGLQISADGINWKTSLATEDITPGASGDCDNYTANVNQIPGTMEPVSTDGTVAVTSGKSTLNMYYGTVTSSTSGYSLTATKDTDTQGTSGHYIVFDVFLKVNASSALSLTADSDVTADGTDKGIKNATRVAFCILGNTGSNATSSTIQALNGGTTKYIWEPNYDVHTQEGVNAALSTYGITTTLGPSASRLNYYGVNQAITTGVPLNSTTTYFTQVTPDITTVEGNSTANQFMTLQEGVTKMRIYMWIEGQDVDCENSASGADINFDVGFSIPAN